MSFVRGIFGRLAFPDRDSHAVPVLDGGFLPNTRLDDATCLAKITSPDSLAITSNGDIYVSTAKKILVFRGGAFDRPEPFASFDTAVGALALCHDGRLLAALSGIGVLALDEAGRECSRLEAVDDTPLACVTAIATATDGGVFVTDGSRHNTTDRWLHDLMENRSGSGRLIACDSSLGSARVIQDGLAWPGGVALSSEERHVLITETWMHRVLSAHRDGTELRCLTRNFAAYPSRICRAAAGGYWIAFFGLRTQLTEFILREHKFRAKMMESIDPNLWIGPSLGNHFDRREPTQIGRIKKLGLQKPWAPPRSYGLVARVNEEGDAIESLHSRVSGAIHGITDMRENHGRLVTVSKGHHKLVAATLNGNSSIGEIGGR
jgi:Strictosidine synthase